MGPMTLQFKLGRAFRTMLLPTNFIILHVTVYKLPRCQTNKQTNTSTHKQADSVENNLAPLCYTGAEILTHSLWKAQ